jgi:hypothetical protein
MIIAALYVILLVGFSRETYVFRGAIADAAAPTAAAARTNPPCGMGRPVCAVVDSVREQSCIAALGLIRRLASQPLGPLTGDDPEAVEAGSSEAE